MSATFLSAYRSLAVHLAAPVKRLRSSRSVSQIGHRIVSAIERALQDLFGSRGRPVPIPVRATVKRDHDRRRS